MGRYLDRLHDEFEQIQTGIDAVVNRAADEDRDVTDAEQAQIDRDQDRAKSLEAAIKHYTEIEQTQGKVTALRGAVAVSPPRQLGTVTPEPEYDVLREFPTIGDYVATVHRALVYKDRDAVAAIERATAHQTTADNPGIIPRPIVEPLINLFNATRPFISSITTRPLPAGKFDRPKVTQHVAVGVQANEKDLTASQKMVISPLPVTAATYAGHLNISRQDIKWSSPGILSLVYEDFAAVYAQQTDIAAVTEFLSDTMSTGTITAWDATIFGALFSASAASLDATNAQPDTLWVSPDVWASLGGITSATAPLFPGMNPGSGSGPLGVRLVVDANFPAGTMVLGPSRYAEWYEDVDGLMTVSEPDVLGQLVGYAGYAAYLNVAPEAFTKFTVPAPVGTGGFTTPANGK